MTEIAKELQRPAETWATPGDRRPGIPGNAAPALTPFELESLRCSMDGRSPRETAAVMKLGEAEIVEHLRSALQKLGCNGKYEAVLKAIRFGLLG